MKRYAAKAVKWFPRLGVGEFVMEAGELHVGDEIVVTGPTTGALITTVSEIRVDLRPVEKTVKGEAFSMPLPSRIRPADRLYVWEPTALAAGSR